MSQLNAILIFSAVIVFIEALVMIFRGKGWGPLSTRLVGLTVIVCAALIVAFADLPNEQRTPAWGLLGVVAGFLAGKPGGTGDD